MKHITRKKVEKIIEYCYFKNFSCRGTAKLLKISKTTANDYYHKFLSLNIKYADLIILPDKVFDKIFYTKDQNKNSSKRRNEVYEFFSKTFDANSNKTHLDYWKKYKKIVKKPYGQSQFRIHLNDWLKQNHYSISYNLLPLKKLNNEDVKILKTFKKSKDKNHWRKAKAIIDIAKGKSKVKIAKNLEVSIKTLKRWIKIVNKKGVPEIFKKKKSKVSKEIQDKIKLKKSRIIEILHQPPHLFDINRTSWHQASLAQVYKEQFNESISTSMISKYLKDEGYVFKKAKKVLTSTDPKFREKLAKITKILSNLKTNEKFFSVDEYGPFAIKIQGGRTYTKKDDLNTYPQLQTSKGSLILTAGLELSTNQMTYFYSDKKNTDEMIKLMYILLKEYKNKKNIYLSWDAASWHISKKLKEEIKIVNAKKSSPKVYLAPLPSCAQFLNVIESVFSGMAKAIIHNSNYQSIDECKVAINKYYEERNKHFQKNPKRAGNKIWGKEEVAPVFSVTNNCKNSNYR
jgi:transposase